MSALADTEFDVAIVGGGAFGAAAAWDATLRGLRVALIERTDFGSGASSECFKMVHGGIRYLQHADIGRLRKSSRERAAFLRIAPHLVAPLPILIPTYGRGRQGKTFLRAGMLAYDLLTAGRNSGITDAQRKIVNARFLDRSATLAVFPELEPDGLTGAAVFDDGQMYSPARLVLAFARSAFEAGAVTANYAEAKRFLWQGNRVCGVRVADRLGDDEFDVRAKLVLNAAGPGAEYLLANDARFGQWQRGHFSRDAYFIVDRKPLSAYALAVPGQSRDRDALVSRTARHLFVVPWRDFTLIGVWHRLFPNHPDDAVVDEPELDAWLAEINASFPALGLARSEVITANCGLVPFGDGAAAGNELSFGKESRIIDHRSSHGVEGLVTLIGIRYTTARVDAASALDLLLRQYTGAVARADTETTPLVGGDFETFATLRANAEARRPPAVSAAALEGLLRNHGARHTEVLALHANTAAEDARVGDSNTLGAEIIHAAREEMAMTLEDVVMRRTDLASGSHPGDAALEHAARILQRELGWNDERHRLQVESTRRALRRHHAARSAGVSA